MSYEELAAARYRAYAEELRTIADWDRLEENRRRLLAIAESYEQMALTMAAIDETNKRTGRWQWPEPSS